MGRKLSLFILITAVILLFSHPSLSQQEDISDVLKSSNQAVVTIVVYDASKKELGQGKGVIVSSDGLVLTNYHLISQAHSARVHLTSEKISKKVEWDDVFYPGYERTGVEQKKKRSKGKWVDVEGIVTIDKSLDFALIKIEKKGHPASSVSSSDQFELGHKVFIVADEESLAEGAITGLKDLRETQKLAQINLPLSSELSGSPFFNAEGEVVGIASYLTDNSSLFLPASYALPLIKKDKVTPLSKFTHEDFFSSSEGLYLRGMAYVMTENYKNAAHDFEESVRFNPNNPYAYSQLGAIYNKQTQFEKAIEAYQKALGLNPNDYQASFGLGTAHLRLNQHQQAVSALIRCTSSNPRFPDAFYNLGLAYQNLEQWENATKAYQQFIQINPGPAWTGYNQLGSVYLKMQRYDQAITAFKEVIKSNPSDLKAIYNLAYSYDMSGQIDQAVPLYRKLIELNPKDAKAYYGLLFRLYDKAGQYQEAIAICQEIISRSPDNHNDYYNLGIVYSKANDHAHALEAFQKVLSLKPDFHPALYNIGLVYFKQKKFADAIQAFSKFAELQPDNPDAHYNIGVGYLQLKKYEQAIKPLQRTLELKPDYALAHYNVALAYYVVGDRFSANEEYKTLRNLNPELAEKLRKIIHK